MEPSDTHSYLEERKQQLGFLPQKELPYNRLLPYADVLDEESTQMLAEIKGNIARAIMMRELRPGHAIWISRLGRYINLYGLKFSKEDHIAFIKLMYECVTIPKLEPFLVSKYAQILFVLLKKQPLLSPDDVQLDWRPLYRIVREIVDSSEAQLGIYRCYTTMQTTLHFLIHAAKCYFPETATQEILDEFMPYVYPLSDSNLDFSGVEWFLPVTLPPSKAHFGYKLWFEDIMELWAACNHVPGWQPEVMTLIARLARYNIGYIDWEPYIPSMFTRFLTFFGLPVFYKKQVVKKMPKIDFTQPCLWIVSALGGGSSCQLHLDKFLKSIETYVHPANIGQWSMRLREFLYKLSLHFIKRLHVERYQKPSWLTPIPDSHKLTDEDIDRFVDSLRAVALQALFSLSIDVVGALQILATLRPKLICPELIDRFYFTLDSLTEPHKLISLMQCIVGVSIPIAGGLSNGYKEGPSHILPMLMAALPGLDPNDPRKCIVTFQFIQVFVSVMPLIDSSKASETCNDLTEEEEELCAMTAGFEDFVCQFFDRCFTLVENSTLEATRMDKNKDEKRNRMDILGERALVSVVTSVLMQSSPEIFQAALSKLTPFVTDRIMETTVGGRTIAVICGAFARVHSVETLKMLLPRLLDKILAITESEEVCKDFDIDDELHYNLLVLSRILECKREGLVPYLDRLMLVLDRCLHVASREGYTIASTILNNIFMTLTNMSCQEHQTLTADYLYGENRKLPIRDWGKLFRLRDLNMVWRLPTEEEVAAAQFLLARYLPPELEKLERHMSGECALTKLELENSLLIVKAVFGAEAMLPLWKEESIIMLDSVIPVSQLKLTLGTKSQITMPDGSNVRHTIAYFLNRLQEHMLKSSEDDVQSFFCLIKIQEQILLNRMSGRDFETNYNGHIVIKKALGNELIGGKHRIRPIHMDRVVLQHLAREEKLGACLTATHKMVMLDLFKLCCSHYSQVRSRAQMVLAKGVDFFPFSYRVILPGLVENFKLDPSTAHDTIKGSLHIVLSGKPFPIIAREDWTLLFELWPAVVRCKLSEKLSIIHLLESLKEVVNKLFQTVNITMDVPDRCIIAAEELYKNSPQPTQSTTPDEIKFGLEKLQEKNEGNLQKYLGLLDILCDAIDDNSLHWRQHSLALVLIRDLVHPNVAYPPRVVRLFLDMLISDSLELRKRSARGVMHCLKQQKRKHKKVEVDLQTLCPEPLPAKFTPGCRPDNMWLQYNYETRPLSAEAWDEFRYRNEAGYGYLSCHRILKFYAPNREQPELDRTIDQLPEEEKQVVEWFSSEDNVTKFMNFLSMEEKKGKDKFNASRAALFKGLFRNHGDAILNVFKPHLQRLVTQKEENYQRCAAEFITGLIRGSKHWPFAKVESLWSFLVPLIQTAVAHITEETVVDWGVCFATASLNRDPNRNHWLLECLMDDPLRNDTSFMESGRLYVLHGAINQQEWRVAELLERLLKLLLPVLDHPFEIVRTRIASVLTNVFQPDLPVAGGNTLGPKVSDFMKIVMPKLEILYSLSPAVDMPVKSSEVDKVVERVADLKLAEGKNGILLPDDATSAALRLFKTINIWVVGSLQRCNAGIRPEYFMIYPLVCLLESYEQDQEIVKICSSTLAALAAAPILAQNAPHFLNAIHKVAEFGSWWARSSNLNFLQVALFHNMAVLRSRPEWAHDVTQIVLSALDDGRIEVREKAAEVLAGLIHCDFIDDTAGLLEQKMQIAFIVGESKKGGPKEPVRRTTSAPRAPRRRSPHEANSLEFVKLKEERERQRLRELERRDRDAAKARREYEEEINARDRERRQRALAERLEKEKVRLRVEREKLEREKEQLMKLERDRQRVERERLEREKEEIRNRKKRLQERPAPASRPATKRPPVDDKRPDYPSKRQVIDKDELLLEPPPPPRFNDSERQRDRSRRDDKRPPPRREDYRQSSPARDRYSRDKIERRSGKDDSRTSRYDSKTKSHADGKNWSSNGTQYGGYNREVWSTSRQDWTQTESSSRWPADSQAVSGRSSYSNAVYSGAAYSGHAQPSPPGAGVAATHSRYSDPRFDTYAHSLPVRKY